MKSKITGILFLVLLVLAGLSFRPLPKPTLENTVEVSGEVEEVKLGTGRYDINLVLKADKNTYYINRGLETGLKIESLRNTMEGKIIVLRYIKHWSVLDPLNRMRHVSDLQHQGTTVFTELDDAQ